MVDFFDAEDFEEIDLNKGSTQRIILIAANFRKEVTSTILWLLNFKLRIQCFRVRPWLSGEDVFLDVDQIIPTKDAEDYMIGLASKSLDEVEAATEQKTRNKVRRQFWAEFLKVAAPKLPRFANISPSHSHYINAGSGVRGVPFTFVAGRNLMRVELYIDRGDKTRTRPSLLNCTRKGPQSRALLVSRSAGNGSITNELPE